MKNVTESETKLGFKMELSPIREMTNDFLKQDESELSELSENSQNFEATKISYKEERYEIDFKDFYVCTDCDPYR